MVYNVLALDLATTTGWARWSEGMPRPFFGAFRLPGGADEVGKPLETLRRFLTDQHTIQPITDVVFEAQHIAGKVNMQTAYKLIAIAGMAEWFSFRIGARCYKAHISEWRKHFIGRGAGFKSSDPRKNMDPKEMAIQKCAEYGWHTDKTDAAEACGILDFQLALMERAGAKLTRPWRDRTLLGGA